ncbi:Nuclear pore protein [Cladobotryum mycophilum]|uniref:Nuclear pore protein n=1 Tax=Cladobotryum mycophilum TaxID=491253 RepID=A0ABR0S5U2_9HYPO
MVTFALPGDFDAGSSVTATPRSRPPLPFAKRTYVATPYASKRFGTPQSSARKAFITRDEVPSSSLNKSTIASARNLFKASTSVDSPSAIPFSPSLPQSTMKKVFAPGATPEPSRVYRESTAKATPRGMASHATEKELFNMRIASPPPELTGMELKGLHLCRPVLGASLPPDFDEEQRRQFFCILDLRRLKYAANEIFAKKSWKLNIINFAKEFEKSRSIILLRYGLYEFQNVKPSKDVLRRWRREHGLPDPHEEEAEDADPTPTKPATSKKRKADDNLTKDSAQEDAAAIAGKRRVTVRDEADEPTAATPAPSKNKRKASLSEEQPSKLQKAAPSSAKSLFEKIASKPAPVPSTTPAKPPPSKLFEGAAAAKSSLFSTSTNKPTNGNLARSVFTTLKPSSPAGTPNSNIFDYLSDANSAKNSGVDADVDVDADAESDTDSEQEDEPSGATSGAGETESQTGSALFSTKPAAAGLSTGASSAAGTREGTPARSLFDRVTKDKEGQPVRAPSTTPVEPAQKPVVKSAPLDQTWNPSTTAIKFAPAASATTNSLFGIGSSATSSSLFPPKSSTTSSLFGAPSSASNKNSQAPPKVIEQDKSGNESDKENDSKPSKKVATEAKQSAAQPLFASSLFSTKPTSTETPKATASLFGLGAKSDASATSSLFGSAPKETPALQSSTLFGSKPAEKPEEKPSSELPKTTSLFGSSTTGTSSLFSSKPATNGTTNGTSLFGASSTPATSLFGASTTAPAKTESTSGSLFSFSSTTSAPAKPTLTAQAAATSLFSTPKSPPDSTANNLFGSPMKQDEASPVKKPFTGGLADTTKAAPIFSFGPSATAPAPSLFGSSLTPATNTGGTSNIFGTSSSAPTSESGSFNFSFGGPAAPAASSSFNNPFAASIPAAGSSQPPAPATGGMFSFGASAASSTPSGGSGMFQFGGASSTPAAPSSAPLFGSASISGSAPAFNVTAPSSQPSSNMFSFGASQPASAFGSSLQLPAGGSSTTGTNSPFNLGGGSSLATTPAGGTPEPSTQAATTTAPDNNDEDGEKHEQINLTEGAEKDEETVHDIRAKVLKFVSGGESDDENKAKSKSPWATQGVGPLRLLKHKQTGAVRLLLRAEPRGNVALNKLVLPNMSYKADEKYVKLTTSNDKGDGLETWMIQVKTKDFAKALAEALEKNKVFNKKD